MKASENRTFGCGGDRPERNTPPAPRPRPPGVRWDESGRLWLGTGIGRPVEAVIFDLGGTLDADGISWRERFEALLAGEFPGISSEEFSPAITAGDRALLGHREARRFDLAGMVNVCVDAQLAALGLGGDPRGRRIADRFVAETSGRLASRRPLLERLARRLPLALVSNGCGNTRRLLADAGLQDLFEVVVDSSECGAWKPDPSILLPALAVLKRPAKCVAVVGDRADRDVACARAAGAVSVWVRGARRYESDVADSAADAVIERVEDLDPGRCA